MRVGIERAPISESALPPGVNPHSRIGDSYTTFTELLKHEAWVIDELGLGDCEDQFKVTPEALKARQDQLDWSKDQSFTITRGVQQLSRLVSGNVKQTEAEFARKRLLDIGCGAGRLGVELARSAKTKTTFFDKEIGVLPHVRRRDGQILVGDASALPIKDEAYPRVVSAFSALSWGVTPVEMALSLCEGLRVTEVHGTFFAIPLIQNILQRREKANLQKFGIITDEQEDPEAMKVWALNDHIKLFILRTLAEKDFCSVSWSSFIGEGQSTQATLEHYSATIDKHRSIPQGLLNQFVAYAEGFMGKDADLFNGSM